jgi:hypothetical protein
VWLLNTRTLKLHPFVTKIPDYVTLSHTWGEQEVTFDDIGKPHANSMTGYTNVFQGYVQAQRDGFVWAWVDMSCVDKSDQLDVHMVLERCNLLCLHRRLRVERFSYGMLTEDDSRRAVWVSGVLLVQERMDTAGAACTRRCGILWFELQPDWDEIKSSEPDS